LEKRFIKSPRENAPGHRGRMPIESWNPWVETGTPGEGGKPKYGLIEWKKGEHLKKRGPRL